MKVFLLWRFGGALFVLLAAALLTFVLLWFAPGDPAHAIATARFNTAVSTDVIAQIRAEAGLDQPFWAAFWQWLKPLIMLDLGHSSVNGQPVAPQLLYALSHTIPLAAWGVAFGLAFSVPLAILAARYPGRWPDRLAISLSSVGAAIPSFWLGLLLILLFSVHLRWLPAFGSASPGHMVLPAITLGIGLMASLTRMLRSSLIEAQDASFLPAFKHRGVGSAERYALHVAPHAALPFVTILALEFVFLLEGVVVVEVIFSRPGLGSFLVEAVSARDFPKVQAVVLFSAALFVFMNFLVDLIYGLIDARMRVRHD